MKTSSSFSSLTYIQSMKSLDSLESDETSEITCATPSSSLSKRMQEKQRRLSYIRSQAMEDATSMTNSTAGSPAFAKTSLQNRLFQIIDNTPVSPSHKYNRSHAKNFDARRWYQLQTRWDTITSPRGDSQPDTIIGVELLEHRLDKLLQRRISIDVREGLTKLIGKQKDLPKVVSLKRRPRSFDRIFQSKENQVSISKQMPVDRRSITSSEPPMITSWQLYLYLLVLVGAMILVCSPNPYDEVKRAGILLSNRVTYMTGIIALFYKERKDNENHCQFHDALTSSIDENFIFDEQTMSILSFLPSAEASFQGVAADSNFAFTRTIHSYPNENQKDIGKRSEKDEGGSETCMKCDYQSLISPSPCQSDTGSRCETECSSSNEILTTSHCKQCLFFHKYPLVCEIELEQLTYGVPEELLIIRQQRLQIDKWLAGTAKPFRRKISKLLRNANIALFNFQ